MTTARSDVYPSQLVGRRDRSEQEIQRSAAAPTEVTVTRPGPDVTVPPAR